MEITMPRKICYVSLVVRDYDQAIEFFVRKLDFEVIEDIAVNEFKRWVLVSPTRDSGTSLLLQKAVSEDQNARIGDQNGGKVLMFLETDDFQRDYQKMRERGVSFAEEPREEVYGTVAVFYDLYRNKWDLLQLRARTAGSTSSCSC